MPLRNAAPSPPQLPDSLHRLAKKQSHRPHDFKTGSESMEATLRRGQILSAGFVSRMENMRLPKCVTFEKLVGCAGCVGRQGKEE